MPLHRVLPSRAVVRRASCLTCTAHAHTICAAVPEAEIDRVALIKLPPRRFPAGATIYAEQPLLGIDAALAKHLAHLVALHEARGYDHLINTATRDAHGRIAHLLVELYSRQIHRLPHSRGERSHYRGPWR